MWRRHTCCPVLHLLDASCVALMAILEPLLPQSRQVGLTMLPLNQPLPALQLSSAVSTLEIVYPAPCLEVRDGSGSSQCRLKASPSVVVIAIIRSMPL